MVLAQNELTYILYLPILYDDYKNSWIEMGLIYSNFNIFCNYFYYVYNTIVYYCVY